MRKKNRRIASSKKIHPAVAQAIAHSLRISRISAITEPVRTMFDQILNREMMVDIDDLPILRLPTIYRRLGVPDVQRIHVHALMASWVDLWDDFAPNIPYPHFEEMRQSLKSGGVVFEDTALSAKKEFDALVHRLEKMTDQEINEGIRKNEARALEAPS